MEELTRQQLNELSDDLKALRDYLHSQLDETKSQTNPVILDQQSVGRVSRIDAIQQQQMAKANRHQSLLLLNRIVMALAAVESGEYGFCKDCEEPIGYGRLKARPDTPLCIQCQSASE